MRVLTLNVNGIRAATTKGLVPWISGQDADIICLQEVRAAPEHLPAEWASLQGYLPFWHFAQRKGYSGVGMLSRRPPDRTVSGARHSETEEEGRMIRADFGGLSIFSLYVPSGITGPVRQEHKMQFLEHLLAYFTELKESGREMIICGDFNIAHQPIDLARPWANERTSGYLPQERAWMDALLSAGFVDTFRSLVGPEGGHYTWWNNFKGSRERNLGWRLDYQIATPATAARARAARIDRQAIFSDHAPLIIDYSFEEQLPSNAAL
jgi:exodeoxyribonuclease-3